MFLFRLPVLAAVALVCLVPVHGLGAGGGLQIQFLLSVNDTWGDCFETVATPMIVTDKEAPTITVGQCDFGMLEANYSTVCSDLTKKGPCVNLVFHSHVIEDASPPTCSFEVSKLKFGTPTDKDRNVLPMCFTMDSREGYHMTYYWFYALQWTQV
eukprot:m.41657 g.41657  ORF g.41657 m.41657 type:complete len:155 (+) comp14254_c0_seq2:3-467(+)